jgi:hypothetical protein
MPSSRANTIPMVIHLLRQLKPRSILDVGIGFGKWGHLFREYTDILEAEREPARYHRKNWRVKIDGIEGHAAYLTPMHEFLYNKIHIGDAKRLMKKLPNYDLIFLGDIIEHFEKRTGRELLRDAFARANRAVIVSTPKYETAQENLCGNELERHRSLWSAKDFKEFPRAIVKTIDRSTLLAVLPKPGIPKLLCTPPMQPDETRLRRFRRTVQEIIKSVPCDEPFILVDEEQVRSLLPHKRAMPFLEKDGQYWGAPPDDRTAIHELKRLRKSGATSIVFIPSCFWWLKHYSGFDQYLRERFRCVLESNKAIIFNLRPDQNVSS